MTDTDTRSELASSTVTDEHRVAAERMLERCTYTTVALKALAETLLGLGDLEGSGLLYSFAERFAAHEEETL